MDVGKVAPSLPPAPPGPGLQGGDSRLLSLPESASHGYHSGVRASALGPASVWSELGQAPDAAHWVTLALLR